MERHLSVDEIATPEVTPDGLPQGWSHDLRRDAESSDEVEITPIRNSRPTSSIADRGPCLYLGPTGQRCSKGALPDGFCAAHGLRACKSIGTNPARFWAAAAAIAGLLWPYVEFIIREIIRWARSH